MFSALDRSRLSKRRALHERASAVEVCVFGSGAFGQAPLTRPLAQRMCVVPH